MEAIDVRNQEYVGYDSIGRLLQLETNDNDVQIALAENQPTHAAELASTLRDFLERTHDPAANTLGHDLQRLVLYFQKFAYKRPCSFWQFFTGKRE